MQIPISQNRMRIGVKIGKELGIDPDTQVCPRHPNLLSSESVRRIILKPFKLYKTVKGKQELDSMGVFCGKCGYIREIERNDKNIVIPENEASNTVETDIRLSPTE